MLLLKTSLVSVLLNAIVALQSFRLIHLTKLREQTATLSFAVPPLDIEDYDGEEPKVYIRRGMNRFRSFKINESIEDFDRVIAIDPSLKPYLWQRGLSLYYAKRYREGADQFALDVSVNPNDTEEAIWHFACVSNIVGLEKARAQMLQVGPDSRPYMAVAYRLFEGKSSSKELALIGRRDARTQFYSNFYLGLYADCEGELVKARQYVGIALASAYMGSGDYMCDVAKIHQYVRGW